MLETTEDGIAETLILLARVTFAGAKLEAAVVALTLVDVVAGPTKTRCRQPSPEEPNPYELAERFTSRCSGPFVIPL
jgi:hypothetical protein